LQQFFFRNLEVRERSIEFSDIMNDIFKPDNEEND
jgi:hypothetical protein